MRLCCTLLQGSEQQSALPGPQLQLAGGDTAGSLAGPAKAELA